MKIEILHRFTGKALFSHEMENNTIRVTVEAALKANVNLSGADLFGEIITKPPITMIGLLWPVLITEEFLRIGCERHTHAEWADFDDLKIAEMDAFALEFWNTWKAPLLAICEAHAEKLK